MINFFDWLVGKTSTSNTKEADNTIVCRELFQLAQEYSLRDLAFQTCVNLIANAVGKCEFRTYKNNKEIMGAEAYLWNVEPNVNQNSTAFLHKMIAKLYTKNEVLIISTRGFDGMEHLVIADSFDKQGEYPSKPNEYKNVIVGDFAYNKTFRESEVMHLTLNNKDIKKVLDAMYMSYYKMVAAAQKAYGFEKGNHLKVHVDQAMQGDQKFAENFKYMMEEQVKPFFTSDNAVLPEFNGYLYEELGERSGSDTRDIRAMYDDIFDFTARAFNIPTVLMSGQVAGTEDALNQWLTVCIDPLCDQLQEEANRKRYGLEEWKKGNYLRIDTSCLIHFDVFANASNVDKLVGSGTFSVNEIRRAAGQPRIEEDWADRHMITKNYATIEEVLKALGGGEQNE